MVDEENKITAESIIERMEVFEADRSNWDALWQECADYGMPGNNQITQKQSPGTKKPDTFQSTAENCILQLAAGLYSYMFPTDSKAFVLRIDDEELAELDEVKKWLDKITTIIHEHLIQSNFRQAFFEFLKSLGCFGTGCIYSEKGKRQPLNFINFHMAGIYIDVDDEGNIDTVYRAFEYTARQAVKKFGEENLGEVINAAYKDPKNKGKKFRFIHAVFPRDEYDDESGDPLNMPWASIYVSRDEKEIISTSGYPENPYQVARLDKDAMENFGRSPTMKELPNIKQLGTMKKTRVKGWEKMCDPPIVLPDDGSIWPLATQPGGVLYKRAGGEDPTWFEFKGNLQGLQEAIQEVVTEIRSGYWLDLFDALIDRQNMTATEVMARVEQKMRLLIAIIGRLQSELFNPLIHRVIGVLSRQQKKKLDDSLSPLLPPMPPIMEGREYRIEYLGRLALALKTLESEGFVATMGQLAMLIDAGKPELLDNFDIDKIARDMSMNNGMPSTWLTDIEKRDKARAARAQQIQAQTLMEQAPGLAKAAKNLSQKPEDGSITQEVLSGAV